MRFSRNRDSNFRTAERLTSGSGWLQNSVCGKNILLVVIIKQQFIIIINTLHSLLDLSNSNLFMLNGSTLHIILKHIVYLSLVFLTEFLKLNFSNLLVQPPPHLVTTCAHHETIYHSFEQIANALAQAIGNSQHYQLHMSCKSKWIKCSLLKLYCSLLCFQFFLTTLALFSI